MESYFEANRQLWNSRVNDHLSSEFYAVEHFRAGKTSLHPPELELLGDVNGKSVLHLQCHFGMDTLSLARMGASVTGIDLSDEAIAAAGKLRDETGLQGTFVCCNVYDTPGKVKEQFDIVFTSYGTIGWLPDLDRWAEVVATMLKPGGKFILVEFHPVVWMFDEKMQGVKYSYFNSGVIESTVTGSYAAREPKEEKKEYGWNHPFAEVITALLSHGLRFTRFSEYDYSPYNCFEGLVQGEDGMWRPSAYDRKFPMLYSLSATKDH